MRDEANSNEPLPEDEPFRNSRGQTEWPTQYARSYTYHAAHGMRQGAGVARVLECIKNIRLIAMSKR